MKFDHTTLQIESTRRCNLDCVMCLRNHLGDTSAMLDMDVFRAAVDTAQAKHVALHGWGEPLLNPGIFGMIEYAREKGLTTELTTNGTLVGTYTKELLDRGPDMLVIGASDPAIFSEVMPDIKKLADHAAAPDIYVDIVLHSGNIHRITELIRLARKLPPAGIFLHRVFAGEHDRVNIVSRRDEDMILRGITGTGGVVPPPEPSLPCPAVAYSTFVTAEGRITPCPFLHACSLGNVKDSSISDILDSSAYGDFVKTMGENPACRRCPLGNDQDQIIKTRLISRGWQVDSRHGQSHAHNEFKTAIKTIHDPGDLRHDNHRQENDR